MVWGTWRGSDRAAVMELIESDSRIEPGHTCLLNTVGGTPSAKCNRGIFYAWEDNESYRKLTGKDPLAFMVTDDDPEIPW